MGQGSSTIPGTSFQVVDPGSADDPFTSSAQGSDPQGGDGAAGDDGGQRGAQDARGSQDGTDRTGATGTDGRADGSADGGADDDADGAEDDEAVLDEYFQGRFAPIQSSYDRQIAAVRKQNDELQRQLVETRNQIREAQIQGLSPDEQAKMRSIWKAEDAEQEIGRQREAVDDFYVKTYAFNLLTRFAQFGVTEEALLACDTPEEMDVLAQQTRADYYEQLAKGGEGKKTTSDTAARPSSKRTPAGSRAGSDSGPGGAPPGEAQKMLTDQGMDTMAKNIKSLFAEPGAVLR